MLGLGKAHEFINNRLCEKIKNKFLDEYKDEYSYLIKQMRITSNKPLDCEAYLSIYDAYLSFDKFSLIIRYDLYDHKNRYSGIFYDINGVIYQDIKVLQDKLGFNDKIKNFVYLLDKIFREKQDGF